jgi:hypothetical protein
VSSSAVLDTGSAAICLLPSSTFFFFFLVIRQLWQRSLRVLTLWEIPFLTLSRCQSKRVVHNSHTRRIRCSSALFLSCEL